MLTAIIIVAAYINFKSQRIKANKINISKIPILLTSTIGMFLGALIGFLSSKYLMPLNWLDNGDWPRDTELTVLGCFFGIIFGGISSVFFVGRKE